MLYVIFVLMFFSFIGGGIMIRELKVYDLIAGYNTMAEKEKAHYDIASVANLLGIMLYFFALLTAVTGTILYFGNFGSPVKDLIIWAFFAIILLLTGLSILVFNKNNIRKNIPIFLIYMLVVISVFTISLLKILR